MKGLSVPRGNLHGAFLGGGAAAMSPCYPRRLDEVFGRDRPVNSPKKSCATVVTRLILRPVSAQVTKIAVLS